MMSVSAARLRVFLKWTQSSRVLTVLSKSVGHCPVLRDPRCCLVTVGQLQDIGKMFSQQEEMKKIKNTVKFSRKKGLLVG